MKPKLAIITLGVTDIMVAKKFYEQGMGLAPEKESCDSITFYNMNGVWLSLYPKDNLAEDATISTEGNGFSGVTIAHNEPSKEEVRKVIEQARSAAGGRIIKEPQDTFWGGYSGYFEDPDGHLWEIAYNPFVDLT